jgi:hypothetical protein
MKNPLSIIGAVVLGVLVSGSSEVISQSTPTRNLSAQTASAGAEELSSMGNPWLNVRTFGAQGDGLADDTAAVQKAIDEAKARRGSVVFFPSGIYVISQVMLRQGISLMGSGINLPGNGLGTILQQKTRTDLDLIVSDQPPRGYHHWSVISNMSVIGASGTKLSSAIRFAAATGEGMKFEHLLIKDFARDGIQVIGGVPFYAEDIHLFRNGIGSGMGYGLDIASKGSDPSQTYELSMISGDDNMTALIHIGNGGGIGNHQAYLIEGVKAEKHTKGRQNDVIVVDDMNGTPVVIMGVAAVNNSGELANSVVKIIRSNARLFWFGLNRDNDLPNGYTHTIDDEFNRRSFKDSAGSAGTYGGSYYFDALGTAAPGSHFGQAEANGDLAGKISIDGAASGSHAFSKPFSSTPVCTAAPASDPGKTTWWVATTASAVTVSLSTPARITFTYQCFGNPD